MYSERKQVFLSFGIGVITLQMAAGFGAWLLMGLEAAITATLLLLYMGAVTLQTLRRIQLRLSFDESEAVNFNDIFTAVQHMMDSSRNFLTKRRKRKSRSRCRKAQQEEMDEEDGLVANGHS